MKHFTEVSKKKVYDGDMRQEDIMVFEVVANAIQLKFRSYQPHLTIVLRNIKDRDTRLRFKTLYLSFNK